MPGGIGPAPPGVIIPGDTPADGGKKEAGRDAGRIPPQERGYALLSDTGGWIPRILHRIPADLVTKM
ncbi:MAG: hypothetical protein LUO93_10165 [Methanomicrobiales archaeon]|nr:hypothetical protein [Methanomicrobiales archaeon]